jgi:hypothetical protein
MDEALPRKGRDEKHGGLISAVGSSANAPRATPERQTGRRLAGASAAPQHSGRRAPDAADIENRLIHPGEMLPALRKTRVMPDAVISTRLVIASATAPTGACKNARRAVGRASLVAPHGDLLPEVYRRETGGAGPYDKTDGLATGPSPSADIARVQHGRPIKSAPGDPHEFHRLSACRSWRGAYTDLVMKIQPQLPKTVAKDAEPRLSYRRVRGGSRRPDPRKRAAALSLSVQTKRPCSWAGTGKETGRGAGAGSRKRNGCNGLNERPAEAQRGATAALPALHRGAYNRNHHHASRATVGAYLNAAPRVFQAQRRGDT